MADDDALEEIEFDTNSPPLLYAIEAKPDLGYLAFLNLFFFFLLSNGYFDVLNYGRCREISFMKAIGITVCTIAVLRNFLGPTQLPCENFKTVAQQNMP